MKRERKSHIWDRDPHDYYVEPEWCSVRLFDVERFSGPICDPACGSGRIVRAARQAGYDANGLDIVCRWRDAEIDDFLSPHWRGPQNDGRVANIVSNPPFGPCNRVIDGLIPFVDACPDRAQAKVALLLPLPWMAGDDRAQWFARRPPYRIRVLTPRPSMPTGAVIEQGAKAEGGKSEFAWFIWQRGYEGPTMLSHLRRDGAT